MSVLQLVQKMTQLHLQTDVKLSKINYSGKIKNIVDRTKKCLDDEKRVEDSPKGLDVEGEPNTDILEMRELRLIQIDIQEQESS